MYVCTVIGSSTGALKVLHASEHCKQVLHVYKLDGRACDIIFDPVSREAVPAIKEQLGAARLSVDFAVQPELNRQKKLVVFDMDSTLIQNECIDLIAARAGVEDQVSAITEAAMRGELDFSQSLAERVALLKGVPVSIYDDLKEQISLTPGARELCTVLKENNVKMAVLSGGFQPIVDWIKGELDLDYAFANTLSATATELLGTTKGAVVDGQRKAALLTEIAEREKIPLSEVAAVGDGSNDLPMMARAGFGIAWHAKPLVQERAPSKLNSDSLADALYYLGYNRK